MLNTPGGGGVAIMLTIQTFIAMLPVPVTMVTAIFAMETGAFCIMGTSFDHVTLDPRDRPW